MGVFGHGGWLSKANKGLGSATYHFFGKDIVTGREKDEYGVYVGYNSNKGISLSTPYFGPDAYKFNGPTGSTGSTGTTGYNYGNVGRSNTTAYQANVAGTANKIAQGGMTKDDILKYNMKHPNEIAGDPAPNNTALNTNTALRS